MSLSSKQKRRALSLVRWAFFGALIILVLLPERVHGKDLKKICEANPHVYFLVVNTNLTDGARGSATRIASAVEKISGCRTTIRHYTDVSMKNLSADPPAGILLSGQSAPWDEYSSKDLEPITNAIRETEIPVLGICGGHQLLAIAYNVKVDRIKRLKPGKGYDGCWREQGWVSVSFEKDDPVTGIAAKDVTVLESHFDEVKSLPRDFKLIFDTSCPLWISQPE